MVMITPINYIAHVAFDSSHQFSLYIYFSRLLYCFNSSPAKDLRAINNMLRRGDKKVLTTLGEKRPGNAEIIEGRPAIKHIKF